MWDKMLLFFRRFSEYLSLDIDRQKKVLALTGEQTNYKKEVLPWRMLWDRCEYHKKKLKENNSLCGDCIKVAEEQDRQCEPMHDSEFVSIFENQMKIYGFDLVKWE